MDPLKHARFFKSIYLTLLSSSSEYFVEFLYKLMHSQFVWNGKTNGNDLIYKSNHVFGIKKNEKDIDFPNP